MFARNGKRKLVIINDLMQALLNDVERDQYILLKKINAYQTMKARPLINEDGYCQGLSILWMQKMIEGKASWFYQIIDSIILCPEDQLDCLGIEIEKLLALIEWGQNHLGMNYAKLNTKVPAGINEHLESMQSMLELDNQESVLFYGNASELEKRFMMRRNSLMFYVAGNGHAIAICLSNGFYHIYDANYLENDAKVITDREALVREIQDCLYTTFDDPVPKEMALRINVFRVKNWVMQNQVHPYTLFYQEPIVEKKQDKVNQEMTNNDSYSFNFCTIV